MNRLPKVLVDHIFSFDSTYKEDLRSPEFADALTTQVRSQSRSSESRLHELVNRYYIDTDPAFQQVGVLGRQHDPIRTPWGVIGYTEECDTNTFQILVNHTSSHQHFVLIPNLFPWNNYTDLEMATQIDDHMYLTGLFCTLEQLPSYKELDCGYPYIQYEEGTEHVAKYSMVQLDSENNPYIEEWSVITIDDVKDIYMNVLTSSAMVG